MTSTETLAPFAFVNRGRTNVHVSHADCTPTPYDSILNTRKAAGTCLGCGWAHRADRHAIPTTITVGEGVVARKSEQTASRDHNVTLVPGTYRLRTERNWTDGDGNAHVGSYFAAIQAVAHDHWSSTVEYGGVPLAGEQRGGEIETYNFHAYGYTLGDVIARGQFTFA